MNNELPPHEPAMGRLPPPLPDKAKRKIKKKIVSSFVKPVPQPGKYEPILNFTTMKDEPESSLFDLNLDHPLDDILLEIAEQSQDALTRMNYKDIEPSEVFDSLQRMTDLYLAAKLIETSPPSEATNLRTFSSVHTMLKDAPIPTPIVDIVNTIGNFESKDESWRLTGLTHKVINLLEPPTHSTDVVIRSDFDWNNFVSTISKKDLTELEVSYQFTTDTFTGRPPSDFDPTDPTSVDSIVNRAATGTDLGQKDEIRGRAIIAAHLSDRRIPDATAQRQLIAAFRASFQVTLSFDTMSPSQIKERVAQDVSEYQSRFMHPLSRVWNLSNASVLTKEGSPSQLLRYTPNATSGSGPLPCTPSDYCLTQNGEFNPEIKKRSSLTWRTTESLYKPSLKAITLKTSRISD